uniref:Ileal sodium/bile acid cotransporter n=1 Tax=Rhabditophanes sp. KR3021 TaxID=114890 RepID=A0AC35TG23_9BILA
MGDKIDLVPSNPGIIQPYPDNFILPKVDFANCVDGQLNYVGIVEVTGRRVGLETIHTSFASSKSIDGGAMPLTLTNETLTPLDLTVAAETLDIRCLKSGHDERLEKVFIGLLVIIISLATVLFGSAIDLDIVWKTIKLPIGPCIGLFTQFFIMPAIATGIAYMIFIPRNEFAFALGIFITACAPGGGASNYWTLLLKGNANLSVSMTFFSNIASLVMMPFWIGLMSDRFVSPYGEQVELKTPFKKIIYSLLSMIIPLVIGVALARKFEGFKTKARQIVRPFLIFVLVFLIGFGCISSTYIFRIMSWNVVLGAALLPFFGFMFGCFTAIVCGQSPENVTAIAIETGVQNTGIAILILKTAFSAPMSDIACLVPILVACATPLPLAGCYLAHTIINKLKKKKEKPADVLEEVHIHEDTKSKAKECPLRIMGEPINEQKVSKFTLSPMLIINNQTKY